MSSAHWRAAEEMLFPASVNKLKKLFDYCSCVNSSSVQYSRKSYRGLRVCCVVSKKNLHMLHLGVVGRIENDMVTEGEISTVSDTHLMVPVGNLVNPLPKCNETNIGR